MNEFLLGRCLIKTSSVLLNALEVFGEVCQTAEEEPMLALKKTFQGSESNVPPLPQQNSAHVHFKFIYCHLVSSKPCKPPVGV